MSTEDVTLAPSAIPASPRTGRLRLAMHAGLAAALFSVLAAQTARATENDVILLPTFSASEGGPTEGRRPPRGEAPAEAALARRLDWALGEAAQDLGLTLDLSARARLQAQRLDEEGLVAQAGESWVVAPRLELVGDQVRVRIAAVAPGSRVLLVRSQLSDRRELQLSAMVMLRDLVVAGRGDNRDTVRPPAPVDTEHGVVVPARSSGRAVLALNGALLGGYVGFSLQRASRSEDARLLYPLIALGTGVGLGASMIAASEWDISVEDAWFLSAGVWWPTASGLMLADAYDVQPPEDRYVYGLVGAGTGTTLATVALSTGHLQHGAALLAHSGGAWGTVLGGLSHMYAVGTTDVSPTRGMGLGAGIGVAIAGVAATQIEVKPSRMLLIDLMAGLGALTGAAVASPLVFGDAIEKQETRAWLASIASGMLVGATVGVATTRSSRSSRESAWTASTLPYAGVIAPEAAPGTSPVFGGGVRGVW